MIDTIERLRSLKKGEKFTFYRGDIEHDITNAETIPDAPRYAKLLRLIKSTAEAMDAQGIIKVNRDIVHNIDPETGKKDTVVQFTAFGL